MQQSLPVTPINCGLANYEILQQNQYNEENNQILNMKNQNQNCCNYPDFLMNRNKNQSGNAGVRGVMNGISNIGLDEYNNNIDQLENREMENIQLNQINKQNCVYTDKQQQLQKNKSVSNFNRNSKSYTNSPYLFSLKNGFLKQNNNSQQYFNQQNQNQNQNFNIESERFTNQDNYFDMNENENRNKNAQFQIQNFGQKGNRCLFKQQPGTCENNSYNQNLLFSNNFDSKYANNNNQFNFNKNISKQKQKIQQNKFIKKGIKKHLGFHNKPLNNYDINEENQYNNNEDDLQQNLNLFSFGNNAYCVNRFMNKFQNNNQKNGTSKQIKKFYRGKKFNQKRQQQQSNRLYNNQQLSSKNDNQNINYQNNKKKNRQKFDIEEQDFIDSNENNENKKDITSNSLLYFNTDLDEEEESNSQQSDIQHKFLILNDGQNEKNCVKINNNKSNQNLEKIEEIQQENSDNQNQKSTSDNNPNSRQNSKQNSREDLDFDLNQKQKSNNTQEKNSNQNTSDDSKNVKLGENKGESNYLDFQVQEKQNQNQTQTQTQNQNQDNNLEKTCSNISTHSQKKKKKNAYTKCMGSMIDQLLDQQSERKKGRKLSTEQNEEMENFQRLIMDRAAQDDKKKNIEFGIYWRQGKQFQSCQQ